MDRLTENIGENDVLLVDVGGGRGHDLEALRARHPNLRGRLVLQDLPDTLKEVSEMENCFETCEYDFFTPQPIQGKISQCQPEGTLILIQRPQEQEHTISARSSTIGLIAPALRFSRTPSL